MPPCGAAGFDRWIAGAAGGAPFRPFPERARVAPFDLDLGEGKELMKDIVYSELPRAWEHELDVRDEASMIRDIIRTNKEARPPLGRQERLPEAKESP
jgi:hypothetical protein